MRKDEDEFKSYTGLTPEKFDILFEYVDPGSHAEMMQYYDAALRKTGNHETRSNQSEEKENSGKKPGPPPTLNVTDHNVYVYSLGKMRIYPKTYILSL